ncbi:MAG: CHAT domain-containing protein, partial [Phormidium sp.]
MGNYLAATYEKLGEWEQAKEAIATSLLLLKSQSSSNNNIIQVLARIYNTKGKIELATGETENALASWQEALKFYTKIKHEAGIIGSKINQAQALRSLGFYNQALKILEDLETSLKEQPNTLTKATALRSLGNAYRLVGKLKESQQALIKSLAIAKQLNSSQDISASLLSLGNTEKAIGNSKHQYQTNIVEQSPLRVICQKISSEAEVTQHYQTAAKYYEEAANKSPSSIGKTQAKINRLRVLLEAGESANIGDLKEIQNQITQLPPSRSSVYAIVNFVQSSTCFQQKTSQTDSWLTEIVSLLNTAIQQSGTLEDKRAQSYALGSLGQVYEYNKQWDIAKKYTNSALNIAQKINADDITYQWNWQLGRILSRTDEDKERAIAAYQEAFKSLQKIRSNLVTLNPDVQYIFREEVEPIYRKLVDLLLQPNQGVISQENLQQARDVMENLQLAELDNFFQDACLNAKPVKIDKVDRTAAVIYPIILPERLDVIVSLPGKSLIYHSNLVPQTQLEKNIDTLQSYLTNRTRTKDIQPLANQIYRWLIQPFESELTEIKTLVFVLDGSLRNIPMAVLYDDKQKYLIEKYAVAIAPGLQLIEPKTLPQKLKALTAGLSEEREFQGNTFSALENVPKELQAIQSVIPTEQLL